MNRKFRLSYTPSKNEFILLSGLIFVIIAALFLNYLVVPGWTALEETRSEYAATEARLETLRTEYANLDSLLADNEKLAAQLQELRAVVPAYFSEEEIVADLSESAASSGLTVTAIGFNGVTTETQSSFLANLKMTSSTKEAASAETEDASAGNDGYITSERIVISFSGTYKQLTDFMTALESGTRQINFRSAQLIRSDREDGSITGTLTALVFSGVDPQNSEYPGYPFDSANTTGKNDPFAAYASYAQSGTAAAAATEAESKPDFYLILNTYDDNAGKVLMGKYPVSDTQIQSDRNAKISATLSVGRQGTGYRYSYMLDGSVYSGTFQAPAGEGKLTVSIISRARKSSLDHVGVTLDVTNSTGLPVVVDVKNDDRDSPRFTLGKTAGTVSLS